MACGVVSVCLIVLEYFKWWLSAEREHQSRHRTKPNKLHKFIGRPRVYESHANDTFQVNSMGSSHSYLSDPNAFATEAKGNDDPSHWKSYDYVIVGGGAFHDMTVN
jgi:hypothetical protein